MLFRDIYANGNCKYQNKCLESESERALLARYVYTYEEFVIVTEFIYEFSLETVSHTGT